MTPLSLPLILITNTVSQGVLAPIDQIAQVVMGPSNGDLMDRADVLRLAPRLTGIVNQAELQVNRELLECAPNLRIVANVAMGTDNFDLKLMHQHGVYATNIPNIFAESAADYTLGVILMTARRLHEADGYVRSGQWTKFQPGVWDGTLLCGKTLGLIGYGSIAQAVEKRAQGFGLKVIHYCRTPTKQAGHRSLEQLLCESDIVSLHLPLNTNSKQLIDAKHLSQMKRGAYLINASRGRIVDEEALVAALQSGHLAGAALDVFENEPQVHAALTKMNNVVLTPHIGGGTVESRYAAQLFCFENIARVLTRQKPLNIVNSLPQSVTAERGHFNQDAFAG
jgi:glyoxylate reductase